MNLRVQFSFRFTTPRADRAPGLFSIRFKLPPAGVEDSTNPSNLNRTLLQEIRKSSADLLTLRCLRGYLVIYIYIYILRHFSVLTPPHANRINSPSPKIDLIDSLFLVKEWLIVLGALHPGATAISLNCWLLLYPTSLSPYRGVNCVWGLGGVVFGGLPSFGRGGRLGLLPLLTAVS